jgi:hypothetical protein
VRRPRLIQRPNAGLYRKLTLLSAPAGFGKTTLVSEWLAGFRLVAANKSQIVHGTAGLSRLPLLRGFHLPVDSC